METQSTIVNFGKHNGKSISQIAQEDMKWVIWLSQNYDVYAFSSPNPYARLKQETINYRIRIKSEAKQLAENYFKQMEETNRETSTSQHTGDLRKRQIFNVTIKKLRYESIVATTPEGNEIRFYDKGFNLQIGDQITIAGTPTKHIEVMGVKQTYINRVKLINQ
jgi:hypothetical protein